FICTKYIAIESTLNLLKDSMDTSYILNMLLEIEKNHKYKDALKMNNVRLSNKPIRLIDMIIALQIITVKYMGFKDNIIREPESVRYVYGYNFKEFLEPVKYIASQESTDLFLK